MSRCPECGHDPESDELEKECDALRGRLAEALRVLVILGHRLVDDASKIAVFLKKEMKP